MINNGFQNKDGSISLIELSKFFNGCGLDSRQWKNLFLDGDENGDEKVIISIINLDHFKRIDIFNEWKMNLFNCFTIILNNNLNII